MDEALPSTAVGPAWAAGGGEGPTRFGDDVSLVDLANALFSKTNTNDMLNLSLCLALGHNHGICVPGIPFCRVSDRTQTDRDIFLSFYVSASVPFSPIFAPT